jgi:alkanesulfonate monooxygenase SsuD/methylene tetrahydromethanopterin reductase-like flavin-dependent oxidoreductase (luciferase family)
MRTATTVEAAAHGTWGETLDFVLEAEKLGLDICWVAEAWGSDAPSPLGYLAARTSRLLLGSGIIQVGTRTPPLIAMTAMTLTQLSGGRFLLGLGPSGPQVIEGLHGVPFAQPLARPMRLSLPANLAIPVYIASMSPRMLELTGSVADGWLGTSFVPEGSAAYFEHLDRGLAASGRSRGDLDVCQGAEVACLDDEDKVTAHVASRKKELAFSLGGMGSASTNFYNNAYSRQGWAQVAAQIRARWQAGDRDGAAGLVTDEMVLATTLIGTEQMVRERLRVWRDAGVSTVRLYPAGDTLGHRLETLGRAIDLVKTVG